MCLVWVFLSVKLELDGCFFDFMFRPSPAPAGGSAAPVWPGSSTQQQQHQQKQHKTEQNTLSVRWRQVKTEEIKG